MVIFQYFFVCLPGQVSITHVSGCQERDDHPLPFAWCLAKAMARHCEPRTWRKGWRVVSCNLSEASFSIYIYIYLSTLYLHIYIDSHPGVDRISDIFKKDFQKKYINSWNMFKTLSFYTFFVFVKSFLASFGHVSGEILKNTKIKQHQKVDRILFQTR